MEIRGKKETINVKTSKKEQFIDLTGEIKNIVSTSGINDGTVLVYVPHTTAGVTINENADPSVPRDILMALKNIVPDSLPYSHAEGNSPAHVKATLVGSSVRVIIENSALMLGTWQGIFFCEFDGPRNRRVHIAVTQ